MPSVKINFKVDNKPAFDRAFDALDDALSDFRPVWRAVQSEFYEIEREQFASEGAAGAGGRWTELSPAYERVKSARYGQKPIMQATGALMESLTGDTSAASVAEMDATGAAFGTRLPYARRHHRGHAPHLPQRELINFSPAQTERIENVIKDELLEQLERTRLVRNR